MSYIHIDNLYKDPRILLFKRCYAMEKIHGNSAHISYKDKQLSFFPGGCQYKQFVSLFDKEELLKKFEEVGHDLITIYGEAYGGKIQKMQSTYGENIKFIGFEIKIGDHWLCIPDAHSITQKLDLEFVFYQEVDATEKALDLERDAPSVQAIRNGCGSDRMREGIVIRPLIEMIDNRGKRIIAKHKAIEFQEVKKQPKISDALKEEQDAETIAIQWVTLRRLEHVMDKLFPNIQEEPRIGDTGDVIRAMLEDIEREGKGEIAWSKPVQKRIGHKTAWLFHSTLKGAI